MIQPARYDLVIPQRAKFVQQFTLPFNCLYTEVEAQVWNNQRTELLLQFTTEWIDRKELVPETDPEQYKGRFQLVAEWENTTSVPISGKWDLLVIDTLTGNRTYYIEGTAVLNPGMTVPAASLP